MLSVVDIPSIKDFHDVMRKSSLIVAVSLTIRLSAALRAIIRMQPCSD